MPPLLGFDIGGTKSAVVLGDSGGRIIARRQVATTDPEPTLERMIAGARELCDAAGASPAAAGVSCGSPLCRRRGLIQAPPNLPHWSDVPVAEMVRAAFDVAVNLENDADAAALAEHRWGHGGEPGTLIYLTCGTGQGAGLIVNGRLHRGACGLAGEIGHVRLLPLGPVGCNKAGSVEGLTSGRALGELAKLRLAERPHPATKLDEIAPDGATGRHVCEAALAGDRFARSIVAELGEYLGRACAILIDVLNPDRISLGSLAHHLGDLLLDPVREQARLEAMPRSFAACTIGPAALADRTQDLAALAAAQLALGPD